MRLHINGKHLSLIFALGTAVAALGAIGQSFAQTPRIKAEIAVTSDSIRLGEIIEGLSKDADIAVFRAPQPGQRGTIRTDRILGAARELGLFEVDAAGLQAISVYRPARTISRLEMENTVADLAKERGIFGDMSVVLDDHLPPRLVDVHRNEAIKVTSFNRDTRNGRFEARMSLPGSTEIGDSWVVTGSIVETREVAIPVGDLDRNSPIEAKDLVIVKRPASQINGEIVRKAEDLVGMLPRRLIRAGEFIRQGDIAKPTLVEKQATVTMIYSGRGLTLSMRGKAQNAGTMGDSVKVQNPQSKKIVEGIVTGANQVTITAPFTASLADASQPRR
jgi:flagellar basal body P-ring formation protein FlgA